MSQPPTPTRGPRPWIWAILNLPFGVTYGYVAVTLGFIASQQGLSEEVVAGLVAACLLPHTWKFLWAPVADLTLTRKKWYLLGNAASAVTIATLGFLPLGQTLGLATAVILVNSVFVSLLGMAVEGLMAHTTAPEDLGKAGGWFQAGNLGGGGIGGGLALLIAENASGELASIATGVLIALCCLGLFLVPTPHESRSGTPLEAVKKVGRDLWSVFGSRLGIVAIALCLTPMGAGSASGLFSAIAKHWQASAELVALIQGVLGGVVSAAGCLVGGVLSDRMNRRTAYVVAGLILAAVAAGMALAPQVEATYAIFCLAYSFASGIAYGTFTGYVLEVIGKGAAATKYNALASLANIPILYMTLVLGWVSAQHGEVSMLWVDAAAGVVGAAIIVGLAVFLGVHKHHHIAAVEAAPAPSIEPS